MAFPLDEGLQLDSLWSSGDLYFENGLEDHGVSGQLVLDKIAPGPGPPQPVPTLPELWPHNVMTLHTSFTVQEVIAAEARLMDEVGTYSPADWYHLLATRFSRKAEQLRQW